MRRRGLAVALLGPDGAGKSTLAQAIAESFPLPVRVVYMGLWRDGVGPLRRPLLAWRAYATGAWHRALGRTVVFDRYCYDAWLPPRGRFLALKRAYFAFLARTCPRPDLTFVLDLPTEIAEARK